MLLNRSMYWRYLEEEGKDAEASTPAPAPEEEAPSEQTEEKEHMLPKSRYDSVARKNRELEQRLAELEAERQKALAENQSSEQQRQLEAKATEIDNLEEQIAEAYASNDPATAKQLRAQQRKLEKEILDAELDRRTGAILETTNETTRLNAMIDRIEADFPELNSQNEKFDKELLDQVQELRYAYESTGRVTPTQALDKAVKFVMKGVTPAKPQSPAATEADRRAKAVEKAVETARKQPPDSSDIGDPGSVAGLRGGTDPDPSRLSFEEFTKLPMDVRRRLRGDSRV